MVPVKIVRGEDNKDVCGMYIEDRRDVSEDRY